MERARLKPKTESNEGSTYGLYFNSEKTHLEMFSSGCTLLDCALGGGFVIGRIANIVGPRSVGKTLLAIEASASFARRYPDGKIFYREAEAAFDEQYAAALGMPIDRVSFVNDETPFYTVEDFFEDLSNQIDQLAKDNKPGLYILDSLDALSDQAELDRGFTDGTYAMDKAKKMGQLFRRLTQKIEESRISLIVISQERDKIGVQFGKRVTRSGGGRALDYFLTHTIWLSQIETLTKKKKINGKDVSRAIGIKVKAKIEKNKISLPFRECEFDLLFGVGIDEFTSGIDWLKDFGMHGALGFESEKDLTKYYQEVNKMGEDEYWQEVSKLNILIKKQWMELESHFLPTRQRNVTA